MLGEEEVGGVQVQVDSMITRTRLGERTEEGRTAAEGKAKSERGAFSICATSEQARRPQRCRQRGDHRYTEEKGTGVQEKV